MQICAQLSSHVWLFMTPWPVARQAPLFMEFSRQEYWSGLSFPALGDTFPIRDRTHILNLLHWYTRTGTSLFLKVPFMSLFKERPTLVPVFTNQKESEESLHFYGKETKARTSVEGVLCSRHYRGSASAWGSSGTATLLPLQSPSAPPRQAARALNCVCECLSVLELDWFYVSVSKMCPKVTTSLLYEAILAAEGLEGTPYFQRVGKAALDSSWLAYWCAFPCSVILISVIFFSLFLLLPCFLLNPYCWR